MVGVNTIYLAYGDEHIKSGLTELNFLQRYLNLNPRQTIVVQNKWRPGQMSMWNASTRIIAGDNTMWEFSGLEQGLEMLTRSGNINPDEPLILANDSFHRHYGKAYLRLFSSDFVNSAIHRNHLVGWVDAYPESVRILGYQHRQWVRSSLMVAKASTILGIFPVANYVRSLDVFDSNREKFFNDSDLLSDNFKRFNKAWLFGQQDDVFRESWHTQQELTEDNWAFMQNKLRAILCEQILSVRAKALGFGIADIRSQRLCSDPALREAGNP